MSEENNISIIKKNQTNNESMKFEFIETMPSSLEPEASATAVEELLEAPADPSATEDADVNIQSLTRPSTPQVTFVSVKKQVRDETQTCTMSWKEVKTQGYEKKQYDNAVGASGVSTVSWSWNGLMASPKHLITKQAKSHKHKK
jgi:hypothetical protein